MKKKNKDKDKENNYNLEMYKTKKNLIKGKNSNNTGLMLPSLHKDPNENDEG